MSLRKDVVIFGAGVGGIKARRMLADMGYTVHGFVDNAPGKWGTELEGLKIEAPDSLKNHDYPVVIASTWEEDIRRQLAEAGLADRIAGKEEYMYEYIQEHAAEYRYIADVMIKADGGAPTFIFGLDFGLFNGGVESWAYVIADELIARNYRVIFLTLKNGACCIPQRFQEHTFLFDINGPHYVSAMHEMIKVILAHSPCVLIDSWQNMSMLAGAVIRMHRQDVVRCMIEVVHNNVPRLFRLVKRFEDSIDYCMGVSREINRSILEMTSITPSKIIYKESPIKYEESMRTYAADSREPLRIGYAARLVRSQKRADLLIPLIEKLTAAKVHFYFQIAGRGEMGDALCAYIEQNSLHDKVELMGLVPREEMNDFWRRQDVFVSVSEYEGTSISMLEAMGNGCVPVVTAVLGSGEFIQDDIGFACDIGNVTQIAEKINYLDKHRELLAPMGMLAGERTRAKCGVRSYVDFLLEKSGIS